MRTKLYTYRVEYETNEYERMTYWYVLQHEAGKSTDQQVGTYLSEELANEGLDMFNKKEQQRRKRNRNARQARANMDDIMDGLGLVKVKGAMTGKTYYE